MITVSFLNEFWGENKNKYKALICINKTGLSKASFIREDILINNNLIYILFIEQRPNVRISNKYVVPSLWLSGVFDIKKYMFESYNSCLQNKCYHIESIDLKLLSFPESLNIKKLLHRSYTCYEVVNGITDIYERLNILDNKDYNIILTWGCIPDIESFKLLLKRIDGIPLYKKILKTILKDYFTDSIPNSIPILYLAQSEITIFNDILFSIYRKYKILRWEYLYKLSPLMLRFHLEHGAASYEDYEYIIDNAYYMKMIA